MSSDSEHTQPGAPSAVPGAGAGPIAVSLANALLAHRPRENSGGPASNRFAYQRTWALCHLLGLHEQPGDYVLILEFHDDILVLDDASEPTAADFFQVKTRDSGQWTRRDLIRVPSAKAKAPKKPSKSKKGATAQQQLPATETPPSPRSILGKLVEHSRTFDANVRSLNLISNACFKVELSAAPESVAREAFCLDTATVSELGEFEKALNAELQLQKPLPWPKLHFRCTPISLKDHETHATGVLAAFLERRLPGGRFAVQPLYRTIAGEFGRRANHEWQPSSFAELCNAKGLRRADVDEFLRHAVERPDPEEQLRSVVAALTAEGRVYRDVSDIQEGWRSYDIGVTDMSDVFIQEFRRRVRSIAEEVAQSPNWQTLGDFLIASQALYMSRDGALAAPLTSAVLKGALLRELKIYETRKPAAVDSQPEEKAP